MAKRGRGVDVAARRIAAEHVEDAVGAVAAGEFARAGDDILDVVADDGGGAEGADVVGLLALSRRWRSASRPAMSAIWMAAPPRPPAAPVMRTLMPDARPARITRVWVMVNQPSGKRRGIGQRPAGGRREHLAGGDCDIFGVAAAIGQGDDLVAGLPVAGGDGDLTGDFEAEDGRMPLGRRIVAAALGESGSLTPAAATRISTSPGPGMGTGTVAGRSTSGPPGAAATIAVMVVGSSLGMRHRQNLNGISLVRQATRAKIGGPSKRSTAMFDDDEVKKPKGHEVGMLLDAMSVEELGDRIAMLEGEIARLKAAIDSKQKSKSAADAFFKI